MAVRVGLGLGEQHRLQPWQENLLSCWSGTSGTLLTQFGTSVVTKGAAPVLAGHWMCLDLGLEGHPLMRSPSVHLPSKYGSGPPCHRDLRWGPSGSWAEHCTIHVLVWGCHAVPDVQPHNHMGRILGPPHLPSPKCRCSSPTSAPRQPQSQQHWGGSLSSYVLDLQEGGGHFLGVFILPDEGFEPPAQSSSVVSPLTARQAEPWKTRCRGEVSGQTGADPRALQPRSPGKVKPPSCFCLCCPSPLCCACCTQGWHGLLSEGHVPRDPCPQLLGTW